MQPGKIPLASQTLPVNPDRRFAFEPAYGVGDAVLGGNTEAQVHMIRHRMALNQFDPLLLTEFSDDPPNAASELPIDDSASVLRHKNNVILAVPTDVRLALPVSHENLLPSERGGSLQGGSLLHSAARRNGRASASLTARGGGLPVGVTPRLRQILRATKYDKLSDALYRCASCRTFPVTCAMMISP